MKKKKEQKTFFAGTLTYVLCYSYKERKKFEATTIGDILLKGVLIEIESEIMVGAGSSSDCDDIGLRHSYVKEGITIADIFGKSLEELEKGFDDYILDTPIKNV